MQSFPLLFEEKYQESENGQGEEERSSESPQQGGLLQFGILPYILKYCEATNERFTDTLNQPINMVLYVVSYKILEWKEQEKQLKKLRK